MMTRNALLVVASCLLAGCQAMPKNLGKSMVDHLPPLSKNKDPLADQYKKPDKIVAIWSDAVYTEPGKPAARGFGGRLYFYDEHHEPVPVQGKFVVYGYDDTNKEEPAASPSRKFEFKPETLAVHYTPSGLGHSYSFWLPWDAVGNEKKTITLLPMFIDASGDVVRAEQSINILPGPTPKDQMPRKESHFREATPAQMSAVQPVSFEKKTFGPGGWKTASDRHDPNSDVNKQRMHTTTIQLPKTTIERMKQNPVMPMHSEAQIQVPYAPQGNGPLVPNARPIPATTETTP